MMKVRYACAMLAAGLAWVSATAVAADDGVVRTRAFQERPVGFRDGVPVQAPDAGFRNSLRSTGRAEPYGRGTAQAVPAVPVRYQSSLSSSKAGRDAPGGVALRSSAPTHSILIRSWADSRRA
ncbi:MAG: hypothetical protein GC151_10075 [Betaproteobacteria bacterium]|nr:hypothetical protein [Betaproteobacteria bacterium]